MAIAIMPTLSGITLSIPGKSTPLAIPNTSKHYAKVVEILHTGTGDEQAAEILELIEGPAKRIEQALADSKLSDLISIKSGVVVYDGVPVNNYVSNKLVELIRLGFPVSPLVKFMEKLLTNPIPSVINRLYQFLEKGNIPITEDGDFEAYKVVRGDYLDKHSGTFDNSVGATVKMLRFQVDDDQNRTCSSGLHVCSYSYISAFGSNGDRLMVCKVNPADVVSIPVDYNDAKMRCCKYQVVREIEEFYREAKTEDVLSRSPISTGEDNSYPFAIQDEDGETLNEFPTLMLAAESFENAEEDFDFEHTTRIRLVNQATGVVIESKTIEVDSESTDSDWDGSDDDESQDEVQYDFYVVSEDADIREGFNSMLGALALAKEVDNCGNRVRIENSSGGLLRQF